MSPTQKDKEGMRKVIWGVITMVVISIVGIGSSMYNSFIVRPYEDKLIYREIQELKNSIDRFDKSIQRVEGNQGIITAEVQNIKESVIRLEVLTKR